MGGVDVEDRRHLALFTISAGGGGLLDLLSGRARAINLPTDAVVYRVGYDPLTDEIVVVVESVEYPLHQRGTHIVQVPLMCERAGSSQSMVDEGGT